MATPTDEKSNVGAVVVTEHDILFECPSCRKSLVVDEAAEGVIVECPKCHVSVIVPPKQSTTTSAPSASPVPPPPPPPAPAAPVPVVEPPSPAVPANVVEGQLLALGHKLKELQTQRTEISNRLAARLNELNRDLVLLTRLEASQQHVISEWERVAGKLKINTDDALPGEGGDSPASRTRVNFGA